MWRLHISTTSLLLKSICAALYASLLILFSSGLVLASTAPASSTPTASNISSSPATQTVPMDPAIEGALIGAIATVIAALVAGFFIWYQIRRTSTIEKEMLTLQHVLEAKYKAEEQKEQRQATIDEEKRVALLSEESTERRVLAYRQGLQSDPEISYIQILNMTRPLEVSSIYIRVRLHEEARPGYNIDPGLATMEKEHDPNKVFYANHKYLESRTGTALTPEDALRRFRHCVVIGDPGAGKTTLLKYLALQSVTQQLTGLPDLPIHISLNAFVASREEQLLDFAAKQWERRYGFPAADARIYMEERLQQGQALVLLDALDETITGKSDEEAEASYNRIRELILQFKARFYSTSIVVTARKAGYISRASLTGFTELEVLDFRQEDITQFIVKWFTTYQGPNKHGTADDLLERLKRNPRIQALAANPLLLSLIVLVYQAQLDLPDRRSQLYKECVDILLNEWDTTRGIRRRRAFKPEYKQQLLQDIAWHFHTQGLRYFPEEEVHGLIAAFLPAIGVPAEENQHFLREITDENGLLKEQAQGLYGFMHLTLQEYFTARYVVDHQETKELLSHRGDPWWEEVFLLYAGLVPDASSLLRQLLGLDKQNPLQEDIFYTNLILAGKCLTARPTIRESNLRQEVITQLIQVFNTNTSTYIKIQIVQTLIPCALPERQDFILSLLSDELLSSNVRGNIAAALGTLGDRSVIPALLPLLSNEQLDSNVRGNIVVALGTLGDRSVIPALLPLLSDELLHSDVRGNIADALGTLGDRSVIPTLLPLLANEQLDWFVRWNIAAALGTLGDRSVIPTLLPLLSNEQLNLGVRGRIAAALGTLGDRSVIPTLLPLLANEQLDSYVRGRIAVALGTLGDRSVIPALLPLLANEQLDSYVRGRIAVALGTPGDRSVIPALLPLLANEQLDSYVRGQIAAALGTLGDRSVIPTLLPLLSNEQLNLGVRGRIAAALGTLGDRSVIPALLSLLSNEQLDLNVRRNIAVALGTLGDRSVIPALLPLLSNEQLDFIVRMSIAAALGTLGDRSVIPALLPLLSNEQLNSMVRGSIAVALSKLIDTQEDIKRLCDLLANKTMRDAVYEALSEISLRMRVRIVAVDEAGGAKSFEVVPWS